MKNKLLVSACLMGFGCGITVAKAQLAATLSRWQQAGRLVIHCPELAAGLPTPRLPAEILGGTGGDVLAGRARIVESDGRDVTEHYQLAAAGAQRRPGSGLSGSVTHRRQPYLRQPVCL